MCEIILLSTIVIICVLALIAIGAAYNNGVTDGYGYGREPKNPGYQRAGAYLHKYMSYRWPELK